jgi:hypothetical protein
MGWLDFIDPLKTRNLLKKPKRTTLGERLRLEQANRVYNPYKDRPSNVTTDQGSVTFSRKPGGQVWDGRVSSELIGLNNDTQKSLAKNSNEFYKQFATGPVQNTDLYRAYKAQTDQEYDQLQGTFNARRSATQASGIHSILGQKAALDLANQRALQPYQFYDNVVLGRLNNNTAAQSGIQDVNNAVTTNLLNAQNTVQTANNATTNRRYDFSNNLRGDLRTDQLARREREGNSLFGSLSTLGTVGGAAVGAAFGNPLLGAQLGGALGSAVGTAKTGRMAEQANSPQQWGNWASEAMKTYNTYKTNKAQKNNTTVQPQQGPFVQAYTPVSNDVFSSKFWSGGFAGA